MSSSDFANGAQFEETNDKFKTFVLVSLAVHLTLIFAVAIKNLIFESDTIVVPPSMRVDLVALPDKPTEEPVSKPAATPKTAPKPQAKPEPAKPKPVENVKDTQKRALEKLKALNSIDKIKNEVEASKEKAAEQEAPKPKVVKGNIVSSGSGFSGLSQLRVSEYIEDLKAKIHEHWAIPQYLSDSNLKASILIDLDERGNLVRREVYATSGNSVFDSSCMAAVANAAPFGPPPNELKSARIMIRFPSE